MIVIKYMLLGIVQGLTEFLPVSSSAHLVILRDLLHLSENRIILEIFLHLGTLLALIVFLLKDLKLLLNKRLFAFIVLATALTSVMVILGREFFENMFLSSERLYLPLFITGIILICTKKFKQTNRTLSNLNIRDSFWLGIMQGFSVIPGISRSGVTISTLLFRNVEREAAFKFSFLASIFAILGALFFKIGDISNLTYFDFRNITFGFFAAFFSGLLALKILLALIRQARLYIFSFYCFALACAVLISTF